MLRILSLFQSMFFMAALFLSFGTLANAQADDPEEVVWVQIEAQQSLARATDRARAYTTLLQDVNGFAVGGGWYAVVVGPYRREDAELVLRQYRNDGLIPRSRSGPKDPVGSGSECPQYCTAAVPRARRPDTLHRVGSARPSPPLTRAPSLIPLRLLAAERLRQQRSGGLLRATGPRMRRAPVRTSASP